MATIPPTPTTSEPAVQPVVVPPPPGTFVYSKAGLFVRAVAGTAARKRGATPCPGELLISLKLLLPPDICKDVIIPDCVGGVYMLQRIERLLIRGLCR